MPEREIALCVLIAEIILVGILVDAMMNLGKSISVTVAGRGLHKAQRLIPHRIKFVDEALQKARGFAKILSILEAVWSLATAYTSTHSTGGEKLKSRTFMHSTGSKIHRGASQVDITSPRWRENWCHVCMTHKQRGFH